MHKRNLAICLIGSLAYFVLYALETPILVPSPYFPIGFISYSILMLLPWVNLAQNKASYILWCVLCVWVILEFDTMNLLANGMPVHPNWFAKIGLSIAALLYLTLLGHASERKALPITRKTVVLVIICASITILAFQIFNQIAVGQNIANEDRSIFIGAFEVHHINFGLLGLLALPIITRHAKNKFAYIAVFCVAFLSYGMLIDEWYYFAMTDVSDAMYLSGEVRISIVVMLLVLSFAWLHFYTSKPNSELQP